MANEKQQLVFTAANENLSLAFRQSGGTDLSAAWHPGASNGSLETLLGNLYGGTVTVTGTLTPSGSSPNRTYSGTLTLAFSGNVAGMNVPQVEVVSGAVREFEVEEGDGDSDYSADGGSTFALGISQSSFQANQRAIGGAHAAVVCIGSSTAPSSGDAEDASYGVSGLGNDFDGTWVPTTDVHGGSLNGHPTLKNSSNKYAGWANGKYRMGDGTFFLSNYLDPAVYVQSNDNDTLVAASGDWRLFADNSSASMVVTPIIPSGTDGTAGFLSYFPVGAAPSAPSSTGTDASNTTLVSAGSISTYVVPSTLTQGSPLLITALDYNYISSDTEGEVVDLGAPSERGWTAMLQVADSTDDDSVLGCTIQSSETGDFSGEEIDLCTFDDIALRGAQVICSDNEDDELLQYHRAVFTVDAGSDPGFAVNIALAAGRHSGDE